MEIVTRLFRWLAGGTSPSNFNPRRRRAWKARTNKTSNRHLRLESLEGRALMATLVWDGNGGNGQNYIWGAWSNWSPDRQPQSGDSLVFSGSKKLSNSNNLSGLTVPSLTIQSNGFHLDGNAITLGSGGLHLVGGTSGTIGLPMSLPSATTPVEVTGARTLNLTDVISGPGGIAKSGTGTAILSAANAYSGLTKVLDGTLRLANSPALQKSTLDYSYGGSLNFGSLTSATLGGLKGNQNLSLTNALGLAVTVTIGTNDQNTSYSGVLGGSGGLTKAGGGTLTLTRANQYTGVTTVSAGTLLVAGSLANSNVFVSGGTLAGGGTIKSVDLNSGVLSPGDGIGTLTVTSGAILDGGTLLVQVDSSAAVDQLLVTAGNVLLGGNLDLSVDKNFIPAAHQVIALVNNAGSGNTSGLFAGYGDGQAVMLNGYPFVVRYGYDYGGDGGDNDVVLVSTSSAPVAVADVYTLKAGSTLVVDAPGLLGNDQYPAGDRLTVSVIQEPAHGKVTLAPDGGFTYTPNADFRGVDDAMVYQVVNEHGGSAESSVIFKVESANDPPVTGQNAFRAVQRTVLTGKLKATDTDSPTLTYSVVTGPQAGKLSMKPDGSFTYAPAVTSKATSVSFAFAVSDGVVTVQGTATIAVIAWDGKGIRPDVLSWILDHNPGLKANFLKTERPDKIILLPNGQSVPIYKLDQFLDVNFRLNFVSRRQEGVSLVETQEWQLRKLMALPEFYDWFKSYAPSYRIAGQGRVSSEAAYDYLRDIHRRIMVTASAKVHAPVGGGNGISAPSWAVWKQMNLFWHEACHVIGIGHNSGGISGPLAGKLRQWDQQKRWNYATIDLNKIDVPAE